MFNSANIIGLLLLLAALATFAFLIRKGGTYRAVGLGLLMLLTWLLAVAVISAVWYERDGRLDLGLILLLALIPAIAVGTVAALFSRQPGAA